MNQDLSGFPRTPRYTPKRLLGMGGMGAVYEVEDRATGGRVALKVMLDSDAGRLLRFKQEFRVMAELHHPNLVRLFDLGQHEGRWFFTMELIHGQALLSVLLPDDGSDPAASTTTAAAGPAPDRTEDDATRETPGRAPPGGIACDPDALIRIVAQILDALEFLHGRGIVHRDLKPSNILVDLEGTVRVLDFGLVTSVDRAAAISQEGVLVGTLAYLSPEQYRGEPASPASDLYALGCMMFQLLTGALPFQGSPLRALAGRVERPPPRVDERVTGVPPALAAIVHRLMARDPAERPTIAEVREALGVAPVSRAAGRAPASGVDTTAEIFVGRQRELSILAGCLERAAAGAPQIALVAGPSGIGKSALGAMAVRRAARLGFLCFSGRCYEREQVPFVAFDRVMDAVTLTLRRRPPAQLAPLRPWLLVLERIFPALGLLTGDARAEVPRREGADPRELHQQAFDGFRHLCAHLQREAPLCFVLDDLQWADEESVALLSAMLSAREGRVLVLGLYRAEAVREGHPLHRLLCGLEAEGRATALALSALGSADAVDLVAAVTHRRLGPEAAAALASQAEGNPFLVRRLAEHAASLPAGPAPLAGDAASADDLIRTMIGALGPRAEQVLALAATAGGDVATSLLREASDLGGEDLDVAVGELLAARFLKAVPPGPDADASPHLDVYHDRIREVVYQGLAEDRRRALHRSLALAVEARPKGRGRDPEILVRHFHGAGDRALTRRYALDAAEQAADKLAFARAARLFRLVLDDPDPAEDPLVTAARWERVGDLFEYGGHHPEAARAYQEAQRRWDEAPAHHPDRAVARLRLRGLVGAHLMATERIEEGRAVFASGLALLGLPLDRPHPRRIAALVGLQVQNAVAERLDVFPAPAEARPFLAAEVRFLDLLVRAFQPFWPGPAAEAALRAELLGRRIDDKRVLQRSLAFGAAVPVLLGRCSPEDLDRAHRRLDEADALARAHDLALGREIVQLNRSLLWMPTNTARARASCEAALGGFARRGLAASFDGEVARAYAFYVLLGRGDDDDLLAATERALGPSQTNFVSVALALAHRVPVLARRGRIAEAQEALDRLSAHFRGTPATRLGLTCARAEASVLVAEGRFAEVLARSEPVERAARATGAWALGLDRSLWLEIELEAAAFLLQRQGLTWSQRRRVRASAEWLAARGVFDFACLGHAALALLDHAEGRARAADRAIRRALTLSSANTSPRRRWWCLLAARRLGVSTQDQEAEAADLAAAGRFALPAGWDG